MLKYKGILLIVFVILFCESSSKLAPDYIVPCPGLKSECLKKTIQEIIPHFVKGIPSLGINATDPLYGDPVELVLPGGVKISFTDGVIKGLKSCIVDNVIYKNFDADLDIHCDVSLKGKYQATGRVLIFSINGDGVAKIKSPNLALSAKLKFEDVTRDGVIFREIKDYKVKYNYNERVTFVFTNLFKGNKELSDTVLAFLNENWKDVLEEFGKPITDTITDLIFRIIKKFFSSIPRDELYIP